MRIGGEVHSKGGGGWTFTVKPMQKLQVGISFCRNMVGMGHTLQIEGGDVYGLCGDGWR